MDNSNNNNAVQAVPVSQTNSNATTQQTVVDASQNLVSISQNIPERCTFQSHVVLMKGITWSRDSHGLFDYESRHLTKKTMKTNA
eukprot:CAMPEP_0116880998 /NCGR_PEP_ID=MMETSP0463-20121206/13047_1 /TAXON_ID=181622 /ORGANISM="Strombidinopsis sp, Strain SopsisLIS2011" /LENGTH=84 /DNA_ID=CAMNT_0004532377 /DNA_START=36 /DNA_END=290 /DNA_ORIENTATION=-